MKRREIKELHLKNKAELQSLLEKNRKELVRLTMEISIGRIKNHRALARKKDDMARIETVLSEISLTNKETTGDK